MTLHVLNTSVSLVPRRENPDVEFWRVVRCRLAASAKKANTYSTQQPTSMQEETLIDYMLRLFEAKLFPIKHYVSFWHARGVRGSHG